MSVIKPSILFPSLMFAPAIMNAAGVENSEESNSKKMNVLLLVMDDLRTEINCYGADYMKTPNIDRLASQGVMFQNAYSNIPVSGSSRSSLFSGYRPGWNRFTEFDAEIDEDVPGALTLPQYFRENGYYTISNGKVIHGPKDTAERSWDDLWHPKSNTKGFRDYLDPENQKADGKKGGPAAYECMDVPDNAYVDGKVADKTINDLRKMAKEGKPFFIAAGIVKPHLPFVAPKKYWDMYNYDDIEVPSTFYFDRTGFPQIAFHPYYELRYYKGIPQNPKVDVDEPTARKLIQAYRACVSYADAQVGKILDELKRLGLDDNTVVVLFGDHGWSLGDHNQWCKHSNFNITNHVPMIIRMPGNKRKGKEEKVVELVDIYPTVCDAAGLPVPKHTEGKSMVKLLEGKDNNWKDYAVIQWNGGVTYMDRNYSYTYWSNKQGKATNAETLFDYSNDKLETKNLAKNPKYKSIVADYKNKIMECRGEHYLDNWRKPGYAKNKKAGKAAASKKNAAKKNAAK